MGDRLGTPGAVGNLFFLFFFPFLLFFFSFSLFFLSFLVCSPPNPLASVIFFCTFRLFFFLMPVTFSRFSFCFRQCFSFSFLLSFFPSYFYFLNSVFNLHTTAEMTDTVVFGKLFSYFFFATVESANAGTENRQLTCQSSHPG